MNICTEFENGRWVATSPEVPELRAFGVTRHEAVVGVTVNALNLLAERVKSGDVDVADDSETLSLSLGRAVTHDDVAALVSGVLHALEDLCGDVPNAETIAAIEELERGGGKSFDSIEELMADLNADD
jgi:hypothetical protein